MKQLFAKQIGWSTSDQGLVKQEGESYPVDHSRNCYGPKTVLQAPIFQEDHRSKYLKVESNQQIPQYKSRAHASIIYRRSTSRFHWVAWWQSQVYQVVERAVWSQGHLRPHYNATSMALKLHLGRCRALLDTKNWTKPSS